MEDPGSSLNLTLGGSAGGMAPENHELVICPNESYYSVEGKNHWKEIW